MPEAGLNSNGLVIETLLTELPCTYLIDWSYIQLSKYNMTSYYLETLTGSVGTWLRASLPG